MFSADILLVTSTEPGFLLASRSAGRPRSRDVLVGAAVAGGLVPELLGRLEWHTRAATASAAAQERDEAVERVLAIDVLHLLAAEGAGAAEVCMYPSPCHIEPQIDCFHRSSLASIDSIQPKSITGPGFAFATFLATWL